MTLKMVEEEGGGKNQPCIHPGGGGLDTQELIRTGILNIWIILKQEK